MVWNTVILFNIHKHCATLDCLAFIGHTICFKYVGYIKTAVRVFIQRDENNKINIPENNKINRNKVHEKWL